MKELDLNCLIAPERILIYSPDKTRQGGITKDEVIRSLCRHISRGWGSDLEENITELVFKREAALPTRFGPFLAVPHAVLFEEFENRIAAAVVRDGVEWDSDYENPIRLVILLVGGRQNHLQILGELADRLRDNSFQRRLIASRSPEEFLSVFAREDEAPAKPRYHRGQDISAAVFKEAVRLRDSLDTAQLVLHADAFSDSRYIFDLVGKEEVLLVTRREGVFSGEHPDTCTPVILPYKGERNPPDVRFSLLYLLGLGVLGRNDIAVCVSGKPDSGFLDSIQVVYLINELDIQALDGSFDGFSEHVDLSVFNRVVHISVELAAEGREGRPVGTIFVLGDYEGVLPYTTKMIANPFHGYPAEDRNILDPGMEETVKEYAKIDGAFLINSDGTIESAGTFLSGQPTAEEMQSGLGARHAAGLGITAVSSAIAVVISESTRKVTVFQSGKKVMEL